MRHAQCAKLLEVTEQQNFENVIEVCQTNYWFVFIYCHNQIIDLDLDLDLPVVCTYSVDLLKYRSEIRIYAGISLDLDPTRPRPIIIDLT